MARKPSAKATGKKGKGKGGKLLFDMVTVGGEEPEVTTCPVDARHPPMTKQENGDLLCGVCGGRRLPTVRSSSFF